MTRDDLATLLEQYHAGIVAELRLLHDLETVAARQQVGTAFRNFDTFGAASDARDELTRKLVVIEEGLREVRQQLGNHREAAATLPNFREVLDLHRQASDLVTTILQTDRESFRALADADLARRAALVGLEHGQATLAAYRKVLAPPATGAALVDGRG
jgi:hypothetical protein